MPVTMSAKPIVMVPTRRTGSSRLREGAGSGAGDSAFGAPLRADSSSGVSRDSMRSSLFIGIPPVLDEFFLRLHMALFALHEVDAEEDDGDRHDD